MEINASEVFKDAFIDDASYVDWVMHIDPWAAYEFLDNFYIHWKSIIPNLSEASIRGGLRAISYAGGLQSRVSWPGTSIEPKALIGLMHGSGDFFVNYLSQKYGLHEEASMWWDDFSTVFSCDDDDLEESLNPVRDALFEKLVQGIKSKLPLAQLGALRGLWNLKHPKSLAELQFITGDNGWATIDLREEAESLMGRLRSFKIN